jgi:uncharacterized integral membrane protein
LQYLAALAEEPAVVAEVAERAPPTDRVEVVRVSRSARAHGVTACTLSAMTKKWLIVGGSVLVGLLLAIVVLLAVLIGQNADAAEKARWERAREICTEQLGPVTDDNLEAHGECASIMLP